MNTPTSPQPQSTNTTCRPPHTFDRTHPDQREISTILDSFNKDPMHLSIISLGRDGVLRNLTADRVVLDAVGLSSRLVKAFLDRVPADYRALTPELEHADGADVAHEQLWHPDSSLLPPPMGEEQKRRALARLKKWEERDMESDEGDDTADNAGA